MMKLTSVTKVYRARAEEPVVALDAADLEVRPGELVTVVGPSGSGKSTLLFTAGGLLRPDSGEVSLDGRDVYALTTAQRARLRVSEIGFVFQTFNLVPYLTCLENVAFPALLAGRSRRESEARARRLLDRLGLSARAGHRTQELSVGERQRVAVARAIVNEPKLVVADEPTANLDVAAAERVVDLFLELTADGQAILMVTHDRSVAQLGHRVVELQGGRVIGARQVVQVVSA